MVCGKCETNCPAYKAWCEGCPGCGALLMRDGDRCGGNRGCRACMYLCPDRLDALREYAALFAPSVSPERMNAGDVLATMPSYIPLVTAPLHSTPPNDLRWFAIHGGKTSRAVWDGEIEPRVQFRLPPDAKTVLHLFIKDDPLMRFWAERKERIVAIRNFDAVFAPNFSVYEDAPRFEHILAIRRSQTFVKEMVAEGIPVIPDVSWYRREDLDVQLEFLDSIGAETVAFSFQVVGRIKGCGAWVSYLAGLRYFANRFPGRIYLVGMAAKTRYREAVRAAGRPLGVVDTRSFVKSRRRTKDGTDEEFFREADRVRKGLENVANQNHEE